MNRVGAGVLARRERKSLTYHWHGSFAMLAASNHMYARHHTQIVGRAAGTRQPAMRADPGSSGLIVFVMLWHVMTMMIAEKKCISV